MDEELLERALWDLGDDACELPAPLEDVYRRAVRQQHRHLRRARRAVLGAVAGLAALGMTAGALLLGTDRDTQVVSTEDASTTVPAPEATTIPPAVPAGPSSPNVGDGSGAPPAVDSPTPTTTAVPNAGSTPGAPSQPPTRPDGVVGEPPPLPPVPTTQPGDPWTPPTTAPSLDSAARARFGDLYAGSAAGIVYVVTHPGMPASFEGTPVVGVRWSLADLEATSALAIELGVRHGASEPNRLVLESQIRITENIVEVRVHRTRTAVIEDLEHELAGRPYRLIVVS